MNPDLTGMEKNFGYYDKQCPRIVANKAVDPDAQVFDNDGWMLMKFKIASSGLLS